MRGFDYKYLPDQLKRQDEAEMEDILNIESSYRRISGQRIE